MPAPFVCLLTGPPGVGKSTLAQHLAEATAKSARVNVDIIRHLIIGGSLPPFPETAASKNQLMLAEQNTIALTRNFINAGYTVFIDDVILEPQKIERFKKALREVPIYIFLLICDLEDLKKRDAQRPLEEQMGARSVELHQVFSHLQTNLEFGWTVLNSSGQSIALTAQHIRNSLGEITD